MVFNFIQGYMGVSCNLLLPIQVKASAKLLSRNGTKKYGIYIRINYFLTIQAIF